MPARDGARVPRSANATYLPPLPLAAKHGPTTVAYNTQHACLACPCLTTPHRAAHAACEDRSPQCTSWQSKGYCSPTYQFKGSTVREYWCPKTCQACNVEEQEEPTATGPAPTPGLRPVTVVIAGTMYPICVLSKVFTITGDVAWGYEVNDYCPVKGKGCSCVVLNDAAKPGPAPVPTPTPTPTPNPKPEPVVQNPVGELACWFAAMHEAWCIPGMLRDVHQHRAQTMMVVMSSWQMH